MSEAEWPEIVMRARAGRAAAGLDLVHPFDVARYNAAASEAARLPDFGQANALGILIGNTRKLWPIFTRAFQVDGALSGAEHPLDAYVTERLSTLMASATTLPVHLI